MCRNGDDSSNSGRFLFFKIYTNVFFRLIYLRMTTGINEPSGMFFIIIIYF